MTSEVSYLESARASYRPTLPKVLAKDEFRLAEVEKKVMEVSPADADRVQELFPRTYGQPVIQIVQDDNSLPGDPLTVGVVLSGGPAPGGHNVIAGLFDALKATNPGSRLLGFRGGPIGVPTNDCRELTAEMVDACRNTGGFDMIGTGRDKIETDEQLARCQKVLTDRKVNALVVVGGDDSNTNAAVLAEHLRKTGIDIRVIGVPKTIDNDLRNGLIEAAFGFDTASKTYSELVGNICRDCRSTKKHWHFVRLMGRSASHITLEVALQTHPNITVISEEVEARRLSLAQVVDEFVQVIRKRSEAGKDYGVALIPEGLLEFLGDMKQLIKELSDVLSVDEPYIKSLPDRSERTQYVNTKLTAESAKAYASLPVTIQEALLHRDHHDNVPLSQIDTERLIIDLVSDQLRLLTAKQQFKGKFTPLDHFFGYEGRCTQPTNFDADYTYALGYAATQLIRGGLTGYTVYASRLTASPEEWIIGGVPLTAMLNIESRKGQEKAVIRKALVDLAAKPFQTFAAVRSQWALEDDYVFPGPIQYFGPVEVCNMPTKTLLLENSHLLRSDTSGAAGGGRDADADAGGSRAR